VKLVTNQFSLQATGSARPYAAVARRLPPFEATIGAHGDPDSITFDELHLTAPWGQASLTNAIGITRTGELLGDAARLRIAVDLSRLPGSSLKGTVSGQVNLTLKTGEPPVALFDVISSEVRGWGYTTRSAQARGEFSWPWLNLQKASATLDNGSVLQLSGVLDCAALTLSNATWSANGSPPAQLQNGWTCGHVEIGGTAEGPLTNLVHTGRLTASEFRTGPLNAVHLDATWGGTGWNLTSASLEAAAGRSALSLSGAVNLAQIDRRDFAGTLQSGSLKRDGEVLYVLQQPCTLHFQEPMQVTNHQWELSVDAFDWSGSSRQLSLNAELRWPISGRVEARATGLASTDLADFLRSSLTNLSVPHLRAAAQWSNGPVQYSVTGAAAIADEQGRPLSAEVELQGDEALHLTRLDIQSPYAPLLKVDGELPIQFAPTRDGVGWQANANGAIQLEATLAPGATDIPIPLGSLGHLRVTKPQLNVHATGTLKDPTADVAMKLEGIEWQTPSNAFPKPSIDGLQLAARVSAGTIDVHSLKVAVDGERIDVSGRWPLPSGYWQGLRTNRALPDWRQAQGHLQMSRVQVATLSRYLPQVLAPEGHLDLDVDLESGGKLNGILTLTNAATRPLGQLTPLRDVSARLRLTGTQATLEAFRGQISGHPIEAHGFLRLPGNGPMEYQLQLQGTNVPLARSVEFLVRGDFDLSLHGSNNIPPTLSGAVNLHHGLYVRYTSDYIWGGPKRPKLYPPYFSITNEPLADWKLDLNIQGDHFLRTRIPLFSGEASLNLKLGGTLRQPVMSGDARIDSGRILFPFGTLQVQEGYASLSGNDPRGPNLQIRAAGRTLNYDVQLDVNGPLDGANVLFSSTPPLNSDEILLMLSAGVVPQNEYTFSTKAKAGWLATYVGSDLFSRYSGSTGITQRFIITSGESISEEGDLTYTVEYRLTDKWSIIGEYDRFNAYNANLKWRILTR